MDSDSELPPPSQPESRFCSRFSPQISRHVEKHVTEAATLAQGVCLSIFKSAPSVSSQIIQLLNAYGLPADTSAVETAKSILVPHVFALEMLEVESISSRNSAQRLQSAMIEFIEQRAGEVNLGPDFEPTVRAIFSDLSAAAYAGRNVYDRAAESFFSRLRISGSPRKPLPRGTWLEYMGSTFLINTRVVRTYMNSLVEEGGGWVRESISIYNQYKSEVSNNAVICIQDNSLVAMFRPNRLKLAGVCLGGRSWLTRPALGGEISELPFAPALMSITDVDLAKATWTKLLAHVANERYVEMIFEALDQFNFDLVMGPDLFPDTLLEGEKQSLALARESVLRAARPGDILLTALPGQELSRRIARLDNGSWSHMLVVVNEDRLIDAQPDGVKEVEFNDYLSGYHRFALCRVHAPLVSSVDRERWAIEIILREQQLRVGMSYSWRGALKAAFTSRFRLRVPADGDATPNAVAYRGNLRPLVVW